MNRKLSLMTLALLLGSTVAASAQTYQVQPAPAEASATGLSKTLVDAVEPQGARLLDPKGSPVCEVWWSKAIPSPGASSSSPDILYGNLKVGTFVGVLRFISPESEDFRDQKLRPAYYTMRYAQIPQDGNHMGVSSYRDFVLLVPLAADTQIDQPMKYDDLIKLSRQASGTGHPAVISLVPVNPAYKNLPAVVSDDQGNVVLQLKLHEKPAGQSMSLAILIVAPPKEAGGS